MPSAYLIESEVDVSNRNLALRKRRERQYRMMRDLDPWRHMQRDVLEAQIWENVGENVQRKNVPSTTIQSTTDTVVAFYSGERPQITAMPKDGTSQQAADDANAVERIGYRIYDSANMQRETAMIAEWAEYAVHRAVLVTMGLWLTPAERGDEVTPVETAPLDPFAGEAPTEKVTPTGCFPVLYKILDPYDCAWATGKDGRVIEFCHQSRMAWDEIVDLFPAALKDEKFKGNRTASEADMTYDVLDYWNEEINAVVVDGKFVKKPTKHEYHCLPVVVDQVNARDYRFDEKNSARMGTPFCYPILQLVKQKSELLSISATYLQQNAFAKYAHTGLKDTSPSMEVNDTTGDPEYVGFLDTGPSGQMVPLMEGEDIHPLAPPPLAPQLMSMFERIDTEIAQSGFNVGILTGQFPAGPSGYAVSQMRLATQARIAPGGLALDRHISKVLMLGKDLMVDNWDYDDTQLKLAELVGQDAADLQTVTVTKEQLEAVGSIVARVNVEVPIDKEQQDSMIIQQFTSGLLAPDTAIDKLGQAQDPKLELEKINFYRFAMSDPATMAALARQYMAKQGITQLAPAPPPPQMAPGQPPLPPSGPGGPPMPPVGGPPPGPPPGPAGAMGGLPLPPGAPAGPSGPQGQALPPELMMALMQQGR